MDRNKIIKMLVILAAIVVIVASISKMVGGNSMTLSEYAALNGIPTESDNTHSSQAETTRPVPDITASPGSNEGNQIATNDNLNAGTSPTENASNETDCSLPTSTPSPEPTEAPTLPIGASLNGTSELDNRIEYQDGFYYESISDNLRRYMTGVSYPAAEGENAVTNPAITFDELRYVHIYHYDFEGNITEGELICNEYIAQDLVEIFYELYRNEYQLEKVLLIDEYDGDDEASMTDNNTSCFNYRVVAGSSSLSKHALGLAIDINPLYNPYITYEKDGTENVAPAAAYTYADRSLGFPYKINENDLCYKLFTERGFIWGGNWNSVKDYQHFQKTKPEF